MSKSIPKRLMDCQKIIAKFTAVRKLGKRARYYRKVLGS